MSKISLFFAVLIAITVNLSAQNYKLVWSDEFDGTSVDLTKWVFEIGNNNGWGNNELEYYTNRKENAYIENGSLFIKAIKESYGGQNYTSARIKTQGKHSFTYGKIVAKIKLPYGKGIWPAFWMLGDAISFVGWPKCGEIDIMEMVGGGAYGDKTTYGTAHWYSNGHAQYGLSYRLPFENFSADYHIFDIVWDSQKIVWHVDDVPFCTLTINSSLSAFQASHFILLNLAVGGNWPGNPDNTTVFPQTMAVDYVRVYQLATSVGNNDSNIPSGFSLEQNYPNPFNPSTEINYSIPSSGYTQLKVYDTLGTVIATLVDEYKQSGNYKVNFNNSNSNLNNGVYFYRLTCGNFSETKKMVLLK